MGGGEATKGRGATSGGVLQVRVTLLALTLSELGS